MQTVKAVTKPSKQRKMLYQAPDHVRHKILAAHLSPELRASHIVKSLPVRSGDTVRVMRGDHKGFEGKITRIDLEKYRIYVEGLTREKVDGTTIFVPVHPSKVVVTRLNLDDKWRKKILERKKVARRKMKKIEEKPEARPEAKLKVKPEEKPPEIEEVKEIVEERAVAEEKPRKKRAARVKRRAVKKVVAEKVEPETEKAARKRKKPKAEKKRTKRKTTKKVEQRGE